MSDRLVRIRTALSEAGLDGLLISSPVDDVFGKHSQNRQYVSGFTGSAGLVLLTDRKALIAVDSRYTEQAERECSARGFTVFPTAGRRSEWLPRLVAEAGLFGKKLGLSRADLSYGAFVELSVTTGSIPAEARPELVPAPPIVESLRKHKDAEELALLEGAISAGDLAFNSVEAHLRAGQTESEIADDIERAVRQQGAEGLSFSTIVAGGPWAALPHATPRDEPVAAGAPLVIDMGAQYRGYCSDLTRTVTIGAADAKFREIYEIVFEAQRAAIEGVEAGMPGSVAHQLAAAVIAAHGYGDHFGHGLGHGVGLEVHEAPYLGPTSEDTLDEGMVFTIEPGIYISGWGGVRIEDVVVLENGHARVLSHANKIVPAGD
ncbi:MAG TPA: Xaa-Pro peptidase family protein [Tepidiformaceae bacterium]